MLQGYAGNCALESGRIRAQVAGIIEAFSHDCVPHAMLKGAARLRMGDPYAQWSHMDDIDVLIPPERAEAATRSLLAHGYRFVYAADRQDEFKRLHHHLAPLVPERGGKSVELHLSLEYPPWFTSRSDWSTLAEHLAPEPGIPSAFVFDGFGRALHALIHGVALYRLGDVVILADELRRAPTLLHQLELWIAQEQRQTVALRAVLVLAARLAGLPAKSDAAVERHLEWIAWREDAPRVFRGRMQLLDAYFSNALSLAIPGAEVKGVLRARMIAGRISLGIAAAGYRALRLG
jgi:NAD(P)-dependent dehydrogenase (short-subunit alcohol dehydrogenase family)